jgi:heterodisulfide reductase subunit A
LPPSLVERALDAGADGVFVAGCREGDCAYRFGNDWTAARLAGKRAPRLRAGLWPARVRIAWVGRGDDRALRRALVDFRDDLRPERPR